MTNRKKDKKRSRPAREGGRKKLEKGVEALIRRNLLEGGGRKIIYILR